MDINTNQDITLRVGDTVRIPGADLALTFYAVSEDSRCPTRVSCVWSGKATISLSAQAQNNNASTIVLTTRYGPDRTDEVLWAGMHIRLISLEPKPTYPDQPVPEAAYVATLWIEAEPAGACPARANDPTGYLVAICRYIQEQQIDVSPANANQYGISRTEEGTVNGRKIVRVFLDCCYLGDAAVIDQQTGQVIEFHAGAK